jgi:hypothetical protein
MPPPAGTPDAVHDEVHWMAVAIETIALVSAVAFAWMHSR